MDAQDLTIHQARKLCLDFGDMYRIRHELIRSAFRAGMSRKEIAAKMGLSRQTVSAIVNQEGDTADG